MALSTANKDKAAIKRVFKGQQDAFRHIIERYQPVVYTVALAQTGHVVLADKAVTAAFKEGYERLVSLTDASRLGHWLCALARKEGELLTNSRTPDRLKPRDRDPSAVNVDLAWLQNELVDPLFEELGPFKVQERIGLLLFTLCGATPRTISNLLKIDLKEAREDLDRTRENVEKALLKEVAGAVTPELNSKERMVYIMREVAGDAAAIKAAADTTLGKPKRSKTPLLIAAAAVVVIATSCIFAYRAFFAPGPADTPGTQAAQPNLPTPPPEGGETAPPPADPAAPQDPAQAQPQTGPLPTNYAIKGRVVDRRFGDGVPGLLAVAGDKQAETDFYGGFEIKGVLRGEHVVDISANGVVLSGGNRLHTEKRNPKIEIDVNENVPAPYLLRGRVTDANTGQVIPNFEVAAYKGVPQMLPPHLYDEFRACSSPEGLFTDRYLTLGQFAVYVRAKGYAPMPMVIDIKDDWSNDAVREFGLLRAATIQGKIFGANELTVSDSWVFPRQGVPESVVKGRWTYATSDARGEFAIYDLPIGVSWLLTDHTSLGSGRAIVVTEPGKITNINIHIPKKGSIAGDITVDGLPSKFKEFRVSSGSVAGSRTVEPLYTSPGQYEVVKQPPGELNVAASVAPGDGDAWFARLYEQTTVVDLSKISWVDINFSTGPFTIAGGLSLRGAPPKSAFVEVTLFHDGPRNAERLFYDASQGSFRAAKLPAGKGEVTVYMSAKSVPRDEFLISRGRMEKQTKPFELIDAQEVPMDFAL